MTTSPTPTPSSRPAGAPPRNPLPLIIGSSVGAFLSFVGFVGIISPTNRDRMFRPDPEAMLAEGHDATTIQQFVDFAAKVNETHYTIVGSLHLLCAIALVFGAMRYKWGFAAYMVTVAAMQISWIVMGLFTPMQLVLPTIIMVMAMFNREILR